MSMGLERDAITLYHGGVRGGLPPNCTCEVKDMVILGALSQ